jgi:cellulose synthase/poly-beta-1,6-N-acetylglucosamine synthase-like glycosyltransferase
VTAPRYTVIIAAYNERELIGSTLESVQGQTVPDWEAIVVDDGSVDDTADRVAEFQARDERIRLVRQENQGLAAARNTALEIARAELISFLDADDLWLPDYLEEMGRALDTAPEAGLAYTDAWSMDAETRRFRKRTAMTSSHPPDVPPEDPVEVMKLLVEENFIWVSATVRRRALEEAGRFRADFRLTEDIELWFRILALGYGVVRARGILGIKREREDALSRQLHDNIVSRQRVLRLLLANEETPASVRRLAEARMDRLERGRLAYSGESRRGAMRLAFRRKLGAMKRATLGRLAWRREPPEEVRNAFPDLQRL